MRQAAKVYLETQVITTSQGQILIMLYDGAIKFLNMAKERMVAKDYASKGNLISSAIDVINELASSLNAEKGGDLAANLNELYFYCNKRLFMANSRMDQGMIDEVITILSGIRNAYAQIIDTPEAVAAMANAPAPAAKPTRSPAWMSAGVGNGAGSAMPASRAHNAYASMGAARNAGTETAEQPVMREQAIAAVSARQVPVAKAPSVQAAGASPATPPEMPALEDMPPINAAKRAAASSLYRKFTA